MSDLFPAMTSAVTVMPMDRNGPRSTWASWSVCIAVVRIGQFDAISILRPLSFVDQWARRGSIQSSFSPHGFLGSGDTAGYVRTGKYRGEQYLRSSDVQREEETNGRGRSVSGGITLSTLSLSLSLSLSFSALRVAVTSKRNMSRSPSCVRSPLLWIRCVHPHERSNDGQWSKAAIPSRSTMKKHRSPFESIIGNSCPSLSSILSVQIFVHLCVSFSEDRTSLRQTQVREKEGKIFCWVDCSFFAERVVPVVLNVNMYLYEGARQHHVPTMLHALALGAEKNFHNEQDHGRTPLIQTTINASSVEVSSGKNAFLSQRSVAAAEFLLTHNAKVNLADHDGQTPLHFATRLARKGRG